MAQVVIGAFGSAACLCVVVVSLVEVRGGPGFSCWRYEDVWRLLCCFVELVCCLCLIVGLGIAGVWSGAEALRGGADLRLFCVDHE